MNTISGYWLVPASAIIVALIAGLFSLLNLVLSKEQKVSELRQAWIEGLREDLAAHIAAVFAVKYLDQAYQQQHGRELSYVDLAKAISEPHIQASTTFHRILLRLNPGDRSTAQKGLIEELNNAECALSGEKTEQSKNTT